MKTTEITGTDKYENCDAIHTLEHFLVQCPLRRKFWESIFKWWNNVSKVLFPLLTYEIIFGIQNES